MNGNWVWILSIISSVKVIWDCYYRCDFELLECFFSLIRICANHNDLEGVRMTKNVNKFSSMWTAILHYDGYGVPPYCLSSKIQYYHKCNCRKNGSSN